MENKYNGVGVNFDIHREARTWSAEEALPRYDLTPEKIELIAGKLFCTEEERLIMLGLLLENVGIDQAIRLGNLQVWREALAVAKNP